jgi:large subunit ribosomal protein L11e
LAIKYDPAIGIFGMVCSPRRFPSLSINSGQDFYCVMARPGMRVAKRRRAKARVGFSHRVTKTDTQAWFKQKVGLPTPYLAHIDSG